MGELGRAQRILPQNVEYTGILHFTAGGAGKAFTAQVKWKKTLSKQNIDSGDDAFGGKGGTGSFTKKNHVRRYSRLAQAQMRTRRIKTTLGESERILSLGALT